MPSALPGSELADAGFSDLTDGKPSVEALLVSRFAERLADAGRPLPTQPLPDAERRMFALLAKRDGDAAHGTYNALTRRMVSYVRSVERAR